MKKVKKMALGGMGAKTQSQLQASVPRTQSQMQNAAQGAFKSAGMNVPNLPKMSGPLGGMGKPPATPPAGLNVAGIKQATAGLGDTFKGATKPPASLANIGSALQQFNAQRSGAMGAGPQKTMKKGGAVTSSASKRGDGVAQRGKTKGRMI